eukprot:g8271.t1
MKRPGMLVLDSVQIDDNDSEALVEVDESDPEAEDEISVTSSSESNSDFDLELGTEKTGELGTRKFQVFTTEFTPWRAVAQQAKRLKDEVQIEGDLTDEDEDEPEDEDEEDVLGWGTSTEQFYGMDVPSKDDDARDDIEESLRLQRAHLATLRDTDFDLPIEEPIAEQKAAIKAVLTSDQNADQEKKELLELYQNLKASLEELRLKISPLLEEAKTGDLCTSEGLTYLKVKHCLLLHYCICILFYILLKLEGMSIEGHPVILRLVEIRTYLEKLKPMEMRLQPQVDKLLKAITLAQEDSNHEAEGDEEELAPRPEELIPKTTGNNDADEVYRPPKINPVTMEEPKTKGRRNNRAKVSTVDDSMVDEIVREITGAPEELPSGNAPLEKMKSLLAARKAQEQSALEEENYSRLTNSSKKSKDQRKKEHYGGVAFEDFANDIEETVNAIQSGTTLKSSSNPLGKLDPFSGDGDVPLGKTKLEKLYLAQQRAPYNKQVLDEDSKEVHETKGKKKKDGKVPELTMTQPPKAPVLVKGKRAVSKEIYKNRGLTPHRTREKKNPRKKIRRQFENKEKKRKGQVRKMHSQAPDHYGGEGSGISAHVRKSVRFG